MELVEYFFSRILNVFCSLPTFYKHISAGCWTLDWYLFIYLFSQHDLGKSTVGPLEKSAVSSWSLFWKQCFLFGYLDLLLVIAVLWFCHDMSMWKFYLLWFRIFGILHVHRSPSLIIKCPQVLLKCFLCHSFSILTFWDFEYVKHFHSTFHDA